VVKVVTRRVGVGPLSKEISAESRATTTFRIASSALKHSRSARNRYPSTRLLRIETSLEVIIRFALPRCAPMRRTARTPSLLSAQLTQVLVATLSIPSPTPVAKLRHSTPPNESRSSSS
jgi:hypothetical protein